MPKSNMQKNNNNQEHTNKQSSSYVSLADQIVERAVNVLSKAERCEPLDVEWFRELTSLIKRLILLGADALDCNAEDILVGALYKCKLAGQNIRILRFNNEALMSLEEVVRVLDHNNPEFACI